VANDLDYYSLLRPLSELAVARQFARSDRYDTHFSSCNRNFHILGERPVNRWCGVCPKCHFVFLALAPFMPKPRLVGIFGRNLLDDGSQAPGFDALLEFRDHKPFECVGETSESVAAFRLVADHPQWRDHAVVRAARERLLPRVPPDFGRPEEALAMGGEHHVPERLLPALRARLGA